MLKNRLIFLFIIFAFIIIICSSLYHIFEKFSVLDSIYITIITLTSVGFSSTPPRTGAGKILTLVLALGGYAYLAGLITAISSAILEGKILQNFKRKKMLKKVGAMKHHIIVCGGGEAGKYVIAELEKSKTDSVLIEKNNERVEELAKSVKNLKYIIGDATDDDVLNSAGIHSAKGIIVVLPSDTENLFVIVTAKSKNKSITVISQVIDDNNQKKLMDAGADRVVSSNSIIGTRLASLVVRPTVVAFLDVVNNFTSGSQAAALRLEEVEIPTKSGLIGKNIAFARIPQKTGLIIIAISKSDGQYHFNPSSIYEFSEKDRLIVLGNAEQIDSIKELVKE